MKWLTPEQQDDETLWYFAMKCEERPFVFNILKFASNRLRNDLDFLIEAAKNDADFNQNIAALARDDIGGLLEELTTSENYELFLETHLDCDLVVLLEQEKNSRLMEEMLKKTNDFYEKHQKSLDEISVLPKTAIKSLNLFME
jgi:hypothetical protein